MISHKIFLREKISCMVYDHTNRPKQSLMVHNYAVHMFLSAKIVSYLSLFAMEFVCWLLSNITQMT